VEKLISMTNRFLDKRENCLNNQIPSLMKRYVTDSIELIEAMQLLIEKHIKLKEECDKLKEDSLPVGKQND